ncbi:MAG: anaerobic ribonucleoside-triphosphate reductase [Candidatus Gastranaerophilaceae bacterium]
MAEAILEQSDCLIDRVKEAVLPLDREVKVVKKDGTTEEYCIEKIVVAVNKSAKRVLVNLTEQNFIDICNFVTNKINEMGTGSITMLEIHSIVECALQQIDPQVALSYRNYRNYKQDFVGMLDKVYQESQRIMYLGDKENSNIDSTLVATKRSLTYNELSKELYKKFFLNKAELQACNDGYIYIHDMSARLNCMNCCLFNISEVLNGGFEMGNIWYNEPKSLDVAFDVIGDIVMSASSQQYGGFTLPEIDTVLVKYAERSYKNYYDEAVELLKDEHDLYDKNKADEYALKKVQKDFEQGFQGWEYKFNTVGSSRGDYPFITVTSGLETNRFGVMCNKAMFKVRMNGQGKKGNKKPVLFPKIVFLYDKDLHGEGGILREVYDAGIACSQKAMYPDWLSLTGEGYIASMYKKYKKVISPMGCRAFLSPWYERGGMTPADENDIPVFTGRFNIGAVSLHLPMIFMKAKEEGKDFYTVLDYYLEMIRGLHLRTYDYLGEMRASINPLAFCEGGFYGGHLDYHAKIKPILESATASFGITALNELQRLYNGKSIYEDGKFTLEVMEHINKKVNEFKQVDGRLYAIYGTPAESLCEKQVYQFRDKYGIIKDVSERLYVSNSFHCHVTEDITPIEKQNSEKRFWELLNGGKIQYAKYPISYNKEAVETLVDRAMEMGFYEGVNLELSYCDDCGHEELNMDVCPKCGSKNLTRISRMNGYLSYSRVKGDTRLNKGKMEEIKSRVSM